MIRQSPVETFEAERKRLASIAYRMLGRWSEAEDAVQDAYLRWQAATHQTIETPAAWLTTVIVRLCLDRIRKSRAAREIYVGPWLPEPVITIEGGQISSESTESLAQDLSLGLLHVLERLGPEERAAFILREAFDSSYADIAATLGKSEPAVRQLVSRARERVRAARPKFEPRPEVHQKLLGQFMSAVAAGSTGQLLSIFRPDIQLVSDGGGKRPAALRIVSSPEEVARLILHLASAKGGPSDITPVTLNGLPSLWFRDGQGFETVVQLDVADGLIHSIFIVRNPDKLSHLSFN
ncbi:MAG: RNA polymerase sigma factor SigJ [Micropepsaceae bacterium]